MVTKNDVTGVTLPLVSYGGSSLVITMYMLGIVVNVMKNNSNILDFKYNNEKKLKKFKILFLSKFFQKKN